MAEIPVKITAEDTDARKSVDTLKTKFNELSAAATSGADRISSAFNRLRSGLTKTFNAAGKMLNSFKSTLNSVVGLVGQFIGIMSFAEAVKSIHNVTSEFIAVENGLMAVLGGTESAALGMDYLKGQAQRLGTDFTVLTHSFLKFAAAGTKTRLTSDELLNMFEAMAETAVILQFNTQQLEGAFRAITQMMSKGRVQAEELRGQLGEHLPGAFEIAAASMGLTTKELDKMLKQGQITADKLLKDLPQGLREAYGKALPAAIRTARSEFNRLTNDVTMFFENNKGVIDQFFFDIANTLRKSFAQFRVMFSSIDINDDFFGSMVDKFFDIIGNLPREMEKVFTRFTFWTQKAIIEFDTLLEKINILISKGLMLANNPSMSSIFGGTPGFNPDKTASDIKTSQSVISMNDFEINNILKDQETALMNIDKRYDSIDNKVKEILKSQFQFRTAAEDILPTRIQQRYTELAAQFDKLKTKYDEGRSSLDEYHEKLSQLAAKFSDIESLGTGAFDGMSAGILEWSASAGDAFNQFSELGISAMNGFTDAFAESLIKGKADFSDFADAILSDLLKIIIRMSLIQPVANAIGTSFGQSAPSTFHSSSDGSFTSIDFTPVGSKQGNVFDHFASGGIVSGYSKFSAGAMGESGPEAIMPLQRLPSGDLGVKGSNSAVTVNITNNTSSEITQSESTGPRGEKIIDVMIEERIGKMVQNGRMDKIMKPYNLNRGGAR